MRRQKIKRSTGEEKGKEEQDGKRSKAKLIVNEVVRWLSADRKKVIYGLIFTSRAKQAMRTNWHPYIRIVWSPDNWSVSVASEATVYPSVTQNKN
jgi:hypothetical protein